MPTTPLIPNARLAVSYTLHTTEFAELHAAQQEAYNALDGARQHALACYEHLGPAGQRASQALLKRLQAAEQQARAAVDAYMQRQQSSPATYAVSYVAVAA